MTKFKNLILLAGLLMSAVFVRANFISISIEDGAPINVIKTSGQSGVNRSDSILASINGHTLTVIFTENLGNVSIEVKDIYGVAVDLDLIGTPNGYECYIPLAGHYTVIFKLSNGDEYSGEFDVTD